MQLTAEQLQKVESLIDQMTLKEKIGQMNLASMSIVGGFDVSFEEMIEMVTDGRISKEKFGEMLATSEKDYHESEIRDGLVGAFMSDDPKLSNRLQKIAVEESRLGIPLLFGFDVIHGFRSVYPIAIAEAGTFDTELMEKTAAMAAKESRCSGVNWHFAPMLDVARDARWGRVSEGAGEDPFLTSEFARAKIKGLQNNQEELTDYVAACMKHYVAYSASEGGRDYNTTNMAVSQLYNTYLPPFKAAVEEGAASAMASFNDINGIPATVNAFTLRRILKESYGLNGFVVSDANAIRECVVHGIAEDDMDAGIQAANAGLDMDMGTEIYLHNLEQAVSAGKVTVSVIDEAVRRVLSVKMWLGLFEHPYVTENSMDRFRTIPVEHKELARESAVKSIVLLKNEHETLPLNPSQKVLVVGSLAENKEEIIGAWAMSWKQEDCVTILDALTEQGISYHYHAVCGPDGELDKEQLTAAMQTASESDVILAVVGESVSMSGEAASKADISIPGHQKELLKAMKETGTPVVAVLMNGRPLALAWEEENLDAILESWHLGIEMGHAVTKVLYGEYNPSGKLTATFPTMSGQCPVYYNHPNTGRPGSKSKFTSKYLDAGFDPLFPFGFGLSYTTFAYSDFTVTQKLDRMVYEVTVCNTGNRSGEETVQFYVRDITASIVRPVKELKGFQKISLEPGECRTIQFELEKANMGFYNDEGAYLLENGAFQFFAGGSSAQVLMQELRVEF
ncbi:MAG: glycoside hydrolase family 3 N-terminal domain-containing protein [Lachnospiraceae bacterium]